MDTQSGTRSASERSPSSSRLPSLYELSKQIKVKSANKDYFPCKGPQEAIISCGSKRVSPEIPLDSICAFQLNMKNFLLVLWEIILHI